MLIRLLFMALLGPFTAFADLQDPVAKFTFNDGSAKDQISGRTAKLVNIKHTEDRFNNSNNAVYLFGNEFSYVNLGSHEALKPRAGSISLWLKMELKVYAGKGVVVNPVIMTRNSKSDDFYEAYAINYAYESERIHACASDDSLRQVSVYATSAFTRFKWHHLVMTFDDDSMTFYIDGVKEGQQPKNFPTRYLAGDPVLIGVTGNVKNNRFMNGIVDDIEVYDRVLTPGEVRALFNAPNPNKMRILLKGLMYVLFALAIVSLLVLLIKSYLLREHKREKKALELNNKMLETELRVNRELMNPHFIFNALNTIQQLIMAGENDKAQDYLAKFSRLIRKLLECNTSDSILLSEEIDILERYIEIEALRFSNVFEYSINVDPQIEAGKVRIPHFIVQPFVENAIWHGLLPKEGNKKLTVSFSLADHETLSCRVEDNGVGMNSGAVSFRKDKRPLALGFVKHRLEVMSRLKERRFDVHISERLNSANTPEGTIVVVTMPLAN
jgi:hypothetical protein